MRGFTPRIVRLEVEMVLCKSQKGFGGDPKVLADSVAHFLRARHPLKTAASVAADTNGACKPAQVEKWLDGSSAPSGPALVALVAAYGVDILAELLPPSEWLNDARNRQQEADLLAEKAKVEKRLTEFYATR